jgi:hypothetical protein
LFLKKGKIMNISEEGIKAYIKKFHKTLNNISSSFFSPEQNKQLFHNSLLPAKIICYVSTQFGVAFEYHKSSITTVETVLGSARVEDLVVRAPRKLRNVGPLFNIEVSNCSISKLTIADGFPFRLADVNADVTFIDVRFACDSLNWERIIEYVKVYGNRRLDRWSLAQAENQAKDEVLTALYVAKRAESKNVSIYNLISTFQEKYVLLLGSYSSEGKRRLAAISQSLRDMGYEAILIEDVPDFEQYDLSQKLIAISALSRFIVVDDSEPSGHLSEVEICIKNRWVTILLRVGGIPASWMTVGASYYNNLILEKPYNPDNPKEAVSEAVKWAEGRLSEMKSSWNALYPWRTK